MDRHRTHRGWLIEIDCAVARPFAGSVMHVDRSGQVFDRYSRAAIEVDVTTVGFDRRGNRVQRRHFEGAAAAENQLAGGVLCFNLNWITGNTQIDRAAGNDRTIRIEVDAHHSAGDTGKLNLGALNDDITAPLSVLIECLAFRQVRIRNVSVNCSFKNQATGIDRGVEHAREERLANRTRLEKYLASRFELGENICAQSRRLDSQSGNW